MVKYLVEAVVALALTWVGVQAFGQTGGKLNQSHSGPSVTLGAPPTNPDAAAK